jgi:hypothetical protein
LASGIVTLPVIVCPLNLKQRVPKDSVRWLWLRQSEGCTSSLTLVQCIIDFQSTSLLSLLGVSKEIEIGAA